MIDVTQQINAVSRTIGTRTLAAGEARVSVISQVYDTDIDDMWEAVTSPERIPRWFLPITGELKEGGHYQLEGNAGGTVTRCDRPNGYSATWEFGGMVSWIEVRLTPADGGVRFELEHVAHVDDELWQQFGPTATGIGWDMGLFGLANHLADPSTAITPEEGAAWAQTEDGKRFMRMSADAWIDSYVATGADRDTARGMADRGYAAYTGG